MLALGVGEMLLRATLDQIFAAVRVVLREACNTG